MTGPLSDLVRSLAGGWLLMLIMPIWARIIFFIIGGIVYLVMLPKRKRDAADRKRLFEERQQKDGER